MSKITVFFFLLVTAIGCTVKQKKDSSGNLFHIPTESEVGVEALTENIAPVIAPFPIINFEKPSFPSDTTVLSLLPDGLNTTTIQRAIDDLSLKGGGTVVMPKGEWITGRIQLKDNINLYFTKGAILKFSGELEDYLPVVFTRIAGMEAMSVAACIYANGATNIAITGSGRLIGPAEGAVRDRTLANLGIDNVLDPTTSVEERILDGKVTPASFPPMFVSPINCTKVYIEGLLLENSAFWNIVPIYCDNVIIRGVTINSVGIPSGDGIDIESSKNVLIEYCTLNNGDDCFTLKSGRGEDGMRVNKATENVVVRNCLALKGHGGVTCGSETAGMIRNLYVHDCVFRDTDVGVRFKTRRPRGGGGENLTYERIRMDINKTAFEWDMLGASQHVGELATRLPARAITRLTPGYKNIHVRDILIDNSATFIKLKGIPESPVNNLTFTNVEVKCNQILYAHDLINATFSKLLITSEDSLLTLIDARNIDFNTITFKAKTAPVKLDVQGELSDSIVVRSSTNMEDIKWFSEKHN